MLSREDGRRLAQLERQLRRDDPEFCARMEGGPPVVPAPRRLSYSMMLIAMVIWTTAIVFGAIGWWTAAAVAAVCATIVVSGFLLRARRRRGRT